MKHVCTPLIRTQEVPGTVGKHSIKLAVDTLPQGMYIVVLESDKERIVQKLIVR